MLEGYGRWNFTAIGGFVLKAEAAVRIIWIGMGDNQLQIRNTDEEKRLTVGWGITFLNMD